MAAEDWGLLELAPPGGLADLRVVESTVRVSEGPVLIALDGEGRRHMLVPRARGASVHEDRQSQGVQIVGRDLFEGGLLRRFADVHCLVPPLNALFAQVADEMLDAIQQTRDDPVAACHTVLDRWRELLRPPFGGLLGLERLAGIFGELLVLREILTRDPQRRLDVWTGPRRGRHDFRRAGHALEVKALLAREGRMVEIHGVEQLEPPAGGHLTLAVVRLETAPDAGTSVAELRTAISALGVPETDLQGLLAEEGYLAVDEEAYSHVRFVERERLLYRVDADFPRIVAGSFVDGRLPPGTLRLRYTSDLTSEPPVPLAPEEAEGVYEAISGGAG